MADFHQTGTVTTLHALGARTMSLESELRRGGRRRKVGVVLPALWSEFESPAVYRILEEMREMDWLHRVVLVLSRAEREQYEGVCRLFDGFPCAATVVWRESKDVQEYFGAVNGAGMAAATPGKGRACWLGTSLLLAEGECEVIAYQDCDIKTYSRRMLERLVYPLVDPAMGYEFSKGYYARVTRRMNGRLTRLMVAPLIEVLKEAGVKGGFLRYLGDFRYPLAGEIAMTAEVARRLEVAPDWGLEISTLSEIYSQVRPEQVCQVDLSDAYDHKHQEVSAGDAMGGLHRMAREVSAAVMRAVAADGGVLPAELLTATLPLAYRRKARSYVVKYEADARMNGLDYERHEEIGSVEVFARGIEEAAGEFLAGPCGMAALPSWERVSSAVPEAREMLLALGMAGVEWAERASA